MNYLPIDSEYDSAMIDFTDLYWSESIVFLLEQRRSFTDENGIATF
jgi:hypothetical protein